MAGGGDVGTGTAIFTDGMAAGRATDGTGAAAGADAGTGGGIVATLGASGTGGGTVGCPLDDSCLIGKGILGAGCGDGSLDLKKGRRNPMSHY